MIPLIIIHQQLEIRIKRVSRIKKFCLHAPMSIYLSWISVATIVNVACALYFYNWKGWGITHTVYTVIMLFAAAAFSSVMVIKYRDIPYAGVTVWALFAIALKHWDDSLIRNVALLVAIVLMNIAIIQRWRN
ncbi:hypothetical protein [Trichormus azollae]|uniref:hypothetical protein n=1 Tax=Trichormus azollae TaxID=1164 RepID=UPI0026C8C77F